MYIRGTVKAVSANGYYNLSSQVRIMNINFIFSIRMHFRSTSLDLIYYIIILRKNCLDLQFPKTIVHFEIYQK